MWVEAVLELEDTGEYEEEELASNESLEEPDLRGQGQVFEWGAE